MSLTLEPLPYEETALAPYISQETLSFHYGKHHKGYLVKLNAYLDQHKVKADSVESLLDKNQPKAVYNNAAQIWNHTFYWKSMTPAAKSVIPPAFEELLKKHFGSVDEFKKKFKEVGANHFGSGWVWLVLNQKKELQIVDTHDAYNPLTEANGTKPLLVMDVWEHAYYIDKRNDRAAYIDDFFKLVNWEFALTNYQQSNL